METFYIDVPVARGTRKPDKVEIFISFFKPGKEHAIKRDELTQKCVDAGLIGKDTKDKDRSMRNLLKRARCDFNIKITNDGNGEGYYLPTKEESIQLAKNNSREDKKAISIFRSHKGNKALEEDYRIGRLNE